jgi:hypothetical protein
LRFDAISNKTSGAAANGVLGKGDFTTTGAGIGAAGMNQATGVWADSNGRLWVADYGNHRILRFDNAASKADGANADGFLGQPTTIVVTPGLSASKLSSPASVYLDPNGDLWVGDHGNNRVVRYRAAVNQPFGAAVADLVLGEPDLNTNTGGLSARDLAASGSPYQIGPGPGGSLFVTDISNSRVLRFSPIPDPLPAPAVTLRGKHVRVTKKTKLILRGTASDANGTLARVEVKVGAAAYKKAGSTKNWKFTAKLKGRKTIVFIRAVDVSGATSAAIKVTIKRL